MTPAYSRTRIRLHWLTAGLIVLQFVFHESIAEAWDVIETGLTPAFDPLVAAHVAGGIAVLALVVWRLVLRAREGAPPAGGSARVQKAAHWGHLALYGVLVLLALSGGAAWFGGMAVAAEVHEALKPVLLLLVAGHAAAALWHQFVVKDGTLSRMR